MNESELAYRRGVHQAYSMLLYFLEESNTDPLETIKEFDNIARKLRASPKPHPSYMHEILEEADKKMNRVRQRNGAQA